MLGSLPLRQCFCSFWSKWLMRYNSREEIKRKKYTFSCCPRKFKKILPILDNWNLWRYACVCTQVCASAHVCLCMWTWEWKGASGTARSACLLLRDSLSSHICLAAQCSPPALGWVWDFKNPHGTLGCESLPLLGSYLTLGPFVSLTSWL